MTELAIDLLHGLSAEESARVMELGATRTFPRGAALFRLGEPADRVFLLLRGCVALTLPVQLDGHEEDLLIEEPLAGQTFGWSGLVPPHHYTLKGAARSESEVLAFRREDLLDLFGADPRIGYTVIRNVAEVMGHRLAVFQTMWLRETQRGIELRCP